MNVGYVYVLKFENEIKIGRTKNPKQRISCIETSRGERAKRTFISVRCSNYYKIETMLHKLFKSKRNIGEYFNCDFDEVVFELSKVDFVTVTDEEIAKSKHEYIDKIEKIVNDLVADVYKSRLEEIERENSVHCYMCEIPIGVWDESKGFKNCKAEDRCKIYYDYSDIQYMIEDKKISVHDFKVKVLELLNNFELKSKNGMYNELVYCSFDLGIIEEDLYNELLIYE